MSISVQCSGCAKKLLVKDELSGKRVKCPNCGQVCRVPVGTQRTPNSAPQPSLPATPPVQVPSANPPRHPTPAAPPPAASPPPATEGQPAVVGTAFKRVFL